MWAYTPIRPFVVGLFPLQSGRQVLLEKIENLTLGLKNSKVKCDIHE